MLNQRSRANKLATGVIVLASVVGGLLLTEHYTGALSAAANPDSESNSRGSSSAGKTGTASGEAFPYEFGVIQLSVTKTAGKITDIGLVQATATGGREQAFSYLVEDAIASQGTSFANLSGATYTTDTFKQALDSAIQKLG